jgi:hypothetical protein
LTARFFGGGGSSGSAFRFDGRVAVRTSSL